MTNSPDAAADPLEEFFAETTPEQIAGDPILQQAFTIVLLASDLFIPVEGTEEDQRKAGGVALMAAPINDQPHVMIFSSEARLRDFMPAGTRFARAPGNAIFPSLRGHHAVLNPGPEGRVMTPDDIARITGDSTARPQSQCSAPGHVHGPDCRH